MYGTKWYFQFGAYEFIGLSFVVGCLYYFFVQRHKSERELAAAAGVVDTLPGETLGDVAP